MKIFAVLLRLLIARENVFVAQPFKKNSEEEENEAKNLVSNYLPESLVIILT